MITLAPRKTNNFYRTPTVNFPPGNLFYLGTVTQKKVIGLVNLPVFCAGRPCGVCIPGVSCYETGGVCVIIRARLIDMFQKADVLEI